MLLEERIHVDRCNLCGSTQTKFLFRLWKSNLVKCRNCGLIYRDERLSDEGELRKYTQEKYMRNGETYSGKREIFYRRELRKINKWVQKGKLLDVGCRNGTFLNLARDDGWKTWGIEVSPSRCAYARRAFGLNVLQKTLKEANFPPNYFDVVTLWDVLDYLTNPLEELREVRRVLNPEGVLVLRMRNATYHVNIYSLLKKTTIFHLYSFSPESVKQMLRKAGFRQISVINSLPIPKGFLISIGNLLLFLCSYLSAGQIVFSPSLEVFAR